MASTPTYIIPQNPLTPLNPQLLTLNPKPLFLILHLAPGSPFSLLLVSFHVGGSMLSCKGPGVKSCCCLRGVHRMSVRRGPVVKDSRSKTPSMQTLQEKGLLRKPLDHEACVPHRTTTPRPYKYVYIYISKM